MLTAFGNLVSRWSNDSKPWTNVYGLARTLMATGTMLTLIANDIPDLFPRVAGMPEPPICQGGMSAGMFCLFPKTQLEIARIVCILLLAVVATGYRPRIFGLVHWFVTVSFQMGASSLDGGDQVSTCLTLLLLPVTLTDTRKWHWEEWKEDPSDKWLETKRFFAKTSLWLCRFQMAGIYFHASAGKYACTEWNNGTALYYWFSHPLYGVSDWARPIFMPILTHSTVALMTWGIIVAEFVLVGGLFTAKKYWKYLLVLGLSLHFGIALFQGLVSFCFAMSAGLILYLRPTEDIFAFTRTKRVRRLLTGIVLKMGPSKGSPSEIGDLS
jgi:antimicrobial peptide system SdpB family protein